MGRRSNRRRERRPVIAAADFVEVEHAVEIEVHEDPSNSLTLLFDPGRSLEERIIREQFAP
jgi:NAD+ kinase